MKALLGLACLFAGGAVAVAQYAPPATPMQPAAPASPSTKAKIVLPPEKAPAAPGAAKAATKTPPAKSAKKEEPPGKVDGMAIPRGEGFLGVQVVDGKFRIGFYDAKKKPTAPDVTRAVVRWDPKGKIGQDRAVLTPSGTALTSDKYVRAPYNFKLFITLLKDGAEEAGAGESFTLDFRQ